MAEAEDLHVVFNLIVNKEQRIPDIGWFTGEPDPASTSRTLLRHDQEFHTSFRGHQALLGLRSHVLLPDYSGYAATAAASLHPANATVADLARAQGALVGFVHPFDNQPDPTRGGDPLAYPLPGFEPGDPIGLPVDAALGKLDFYEAVSSGRLPPAESALENPLRPQQMMRNGRGRQVASEPTSPITSPITSPTTVQPHYLT